MNQSQLKKKINVVEQTVKYTLDKEYNTCTTLANKIKRSQ